MQEDFCTWLHITSLVIYLLFMASQWNTIEISPPITVMSALSVNVCSAWVVMGEFNDMV